MSQEILRRAEVIYDLEGDYLRRLIQQNPSYAALDKTLKQLQARLSGSLNVDQARALAKTQRLLLELTREAAFKMGYLYAHTYPLDEVASL